MIIYMNNATCLLYNSNIAHNIKGNSRIFWNLKFDIIKSYGFISLFLEFFGFIDTVYDI